MLRLAVALCLVSVALAGPPTSRTREEIESFRDFLERSRNSDGVVLKSSVGNAWENSGKYQGDILLDDHQVEQMVEGYATGRNAYLWPNTRWPQNIVIYEFPNGEFNNAQRDMILAGMREIEQRTCVRFRQRTNERAFVRITGRSDGCYAHVGYWASRGVHTFNVARAEPGRGCFHHAIIIHEWLHIIGFFHMQSTHNRDDYVRVMWENIQPGMEHNFEKYTSDLVSNLNLPYEYTSTMHYDGYGFSTNGRPTLVPLRDFDGEMGQIEYVTDLDYLRVNRHYNCPGAWN